MLSAPRAYWMFKVFGAPNAFLLDGTLQKWMVEGNTMVKQERASREEARDEDFAYKRNEDLVYKFDDISEDHLILDSRFSQVFDQGCIPKSVNIPFTEVLNQDRSFKNESELEKVFKSYGVNDPSTQEVVLTC